MMKQTIRNLLLLTAMIIAGAGQVWANVPTYGTISYTQGENDGGTLLFYSDAALEYPIELSETGQSEHLTSVTVYIKALTDAIHTLGEDASFITVEKTQTASNIQAPRRTLDAGDYCEVTAVQGKAGVYQFTMPEGEDINVSVTVTFPSKQTASVSYIKADGTQGTQTAYELDGTETELGQDNEETWYVCMKDVTFDHGLTLVGDVNIIIPDGKKLSVGTSDNGVSDICFTTGANHLGFYGQASATGKLYIHNNGVYNNEIPSNSNHYCIKLDTEGSLSVSNIDVELKSVNGWGVYAANDNTKSITFVGHSTKGNAFIVNNRYQCIDAGGASVSIKNYNIEANCSNSLGFDVGSLDIEGLEDGNNSVSVSSGYECLYVRGNLSIKYCDLNLSGNNSAAIHMYSENTEYGVSFLGHPTKGNTLTIRNGADCIHAENNPVDIKYYNLVLTGKQIENSDEYGNCCSSFGNNAVTAKTLNIEGLADGTNSVIVKSSNQGFYSPGGITIKYCDIDILSANQVFSTYDNGDCSPISIEGIDKGNTVKIRANGANGYGLDGSSVNLKNCIIDTETKYSFIRTYSNKQTSSITNCILTATNTNNNTIYTKGDLTIDGGQVNITSEDIDKTNTAGIWASGCNVTLGWQDAEKDFIKVSSYKVENGSITTAEGQRFVAYTPATETVPEAATSIISGETGPDLIDGMVLRPIAGYLVSTTDDNLTIKDNEPKFSIDDNGKTERYYEFAASTDEDPVRVTVEYTIPENAEYKMRMIVADGAKLETDHGFLMPENDILMYGQPVNVQNVENGTYNGKSQTPGLYYSSALNAPARRSRAANMTLDEQYSIKEIFKQTGVDTENNDAPIYGEEVEAAVNAGNYQFTVAGLGDFFGTADVEFTIERQSMWNVRTTILNPDKTDDNEACFNYTGQEIKPDQIELTCMGSGSDERITIPSKDYSISYPDNKEYLNAGDYTIKVSAKEDGNYDFVEETVSFQIVDHVDETCGGAMKYSFYSVDTDIDNDQQTDIPAGTLILTGEGLISETPWTGYKASLEEDALNAVKTVTINMTGAKIDIPAGAFADLQAENIKLNFTGTKPTEGEFVVKLNGTALQADENETDKFTIPVASLGATGDATDVLFATCVVTEQAPKKGNSNENENFMGYTPTSGNMKLTGNAKAWIMTSCDFANGQVGISKVEAGEIPEGAVVLLSGELPSGVDEPQPLPDQITLQSALNVSTETRSIMQEALPNLVASTGIETVEQLITKAMTPKGGPSPGKINVEDYFGYTLRHGAFRGVDLRGGKAVSKGTIVLFANYLDVVLKKALGTSNAPQFTIPIDLGDGEMTDIDEHELRNSNGLSKDGWYTVDGRKLDKQPTAKGLYIRNGRKMVIK